MRSPATLSARAGNVHRPTSTPGTVAAQTPARRQRHVSDTLPVTNTVRESPQGLSFVRHDPAGSGKPQTDLRRHANCAPSRVEYLHGDVGNDGPVDETPHRAGDAASARQREVGPRCGSATRDREGVP